MGERTIDMIDEGFDIAVRLTPPPDSSLIVRSLATWRHVLCCSHGYLEEHGRAQQLAELAGHNCVRHVNYPFEDEWRSVDRKGAPASVRVSGNLRHQQRRNVAQGRAAGRRHLSCGRLSGA